MQLSIYKENFIIFMKVLFLDKLRKRTSIISCLQEQLRNLYIWSALVWIMKWLHLLSQKLNNKGVTGWHEQQAQVWTNSSHTLELLISDGQYVHTKPWNILTIKLIPSKSISPFNVYLVMLQIRLEWVNSVCFMARSKRFRKVRKGL